MALLDANAVALQTSYYSLLTLSLLILAGNTCFPPFLRLILWTMKKLIPESATSSPWQLRRRTLEFCLDHPRRVYTNMFPSKQTWWLVFSLVVLNGIDWVAFEVRIRPNILLSHLALDEVSKVGQPDLDRLMARQDRRRGLPVGIVPEVAKFRADLGL